MSKLKGNKTPFNQLPDKVTTINLKDRLVEFNEKEHMLNIAEATKKYFAEKTKKGKSKNLTPESLRADKKWHISGSRPINYWSEARLKEEISKGIPFSASAWLPNNNISGIVLFNRTAEIKWNNIITNLNTRGGLFWDALHITVVVYKNTYVTVIGNHCIVKSIFQEGYGALVPCNVIYLGEEADPLTYMAKIHDSDANKRTNQSALDRVVSQTHAGDPIGEETMKVMIALGFNIKGQVKPNGLALKTISSHQIVKGIVNAYTFDVVERAANAMRKVWKYDEEINATALEVLSTTLYYFAEDFKRIGKKEDVFLSFLKWKKETLFEQKDLLVDTGKNKDPMISVVNLISEFNKFACSNLMVLKGFEKQNKRPIGVGVFTNRVGDDNVPANIGNLK